MKAEQKSRTKEIQTLKSKIEVLIAALKRVQPFLAHTCPVSTDTSPLKDGWDTCPRCIVVAILELEEIGLLGDCGDLRVGIPGASSQLK